MDIVFGFVGLYFYLALTIVNIGIAQEKDRNQIWAAVCSIVFTPIIVWMYYVAVPPKDRHDV